MKVILILLARRLSNTKTSTSVGVITAAILPTGATIDTAENTSSSTTAENRAENTTSCRAENSTGPDDNSKHTSTAVKAAAAKVPSIFTKRAK